MGEIKRKVKYIEVDMVCDDCGDGRMRPTITVLRQYPPKYVHMCDKCGKEGIYDVMYPYMQRSDGTIYYEEGRK